jgi:hypothetical protein
MDSLKTKITSAKQMSKIDFINFADGLTWAAGTYQRVIFVPEHARICGFGIMVGIDTGGDTGTNTFSIGHGAGTAQTDTGMTHIAATADVDAYAKAVIIQTVGFTGPERGPVDAGVTAGVELMGKPPTVTSSATYTYAPSSTSPWSSSGEKVVPVIGELIIGATQTTGALHWWVEYCFDPNIVWTQAALA